MGENSNQGAGGGERKVPRTAPVAIPRGPRVDMGKPPGPGQISSTPRKSSAPAPKLRASPGDAKAAAANPARQRDAGGKSRSSAGSQAMGQQLIDALASAQQLNAQQAERNLAGRWDKKPGDADPMKFRRTLIPVLFTSGFILLVAGVYLLSGGEDSAIIDLFPNWTPFVLLAAAVMSFVAAAVNVYSIRSISR